MRIHSAARDHLKSAPDCPASAVLGRRISNCGLHATHRDHQLWRSSEAVRKRSSTLRALMRTSFEHAHASGVADCSCPCDADGLAIWSPAEHRVQRVHICSWKSRMAAPRLPRSAFACRARSSTSRCDGGTPCCRRELPPPCSTTSSLERVNDLPYPIHRHPSVSSPFDVRTGACGSKCVLSLETHCESRGRTGRRADSGRETGGCGERGQISAKMAVTGASSPRRAAYMPSC